MKGKRIFLLEWWLRISLSAGFLSAVADRFGFWSKAHSSWGNWTAFICYTQTLNPWFSEPMFSVMGALATLFELVF